MANRTFYPSQNYGHNRVYCEFLFQTNGASNPLLTTVDGADVVASLVRSGVGVIVVTLKDAYNKAIFASADLDDTPNDGAYATIKSVSNEGTNTPIAFTITTRAGATTTATDYTGRVCRISLAFRNSASGLK